MRKTSLLLVLLAALFCGGCATRLFDDIGDALPVSRGELNEIAEQVERTSSDASSGNVFGVIGGSLASLGLAIAAAARMTRRRLEVFDSEAYVGNGETATEEEIVTATRAVVDRSPPPA